MHCSHMACNYLIQSAEIPPQPNFFKARDLGTANLLGGIECVEKMSFKQKSYVSGWPLAAYVITLQLKLG